MWLWIKHWVDWAMTDVLRLSHTRPHGQALHTRYEKAGLSLYDLLAEAVAIVGGKLPH